MHSKDQVGTDVKVTKEQLQAANFAELTKLLGDNNSCKNCISCKSCNSCENCSDCRNCESCNSCSNCDSCEKCRHCMHCLDCVDCIFCLYCTGQQGKKWMIKNVQFSEEEYKALTGRIAYRGEPIVLSTEEDCTLSTAEVRRTCTVS
jgi:hypothetical protein